MATKKVAEKTPEVEDEQLRDYELVLIVSPEVTNEALETTIEKTSQLATGKGGSITDVEQWGKRKLAYPIGRFMEGSYVLIRLKLKPALTRELQAKLGISDDVLRHLLIRLVS